VLVNDGFFIFTLLQQTDHILSLLLTLLALNAFAAYLHIQRYHWVWLGLSLVMVILTTLDREAALPILGGVPLLLILADRRWSKSLWAGLAAWYAILFLSAWRIYLTLRASGNYPGNTFKDLNPERMMWASVNQLDFAFRAMTQLSPKDFYPFWPATLLAISSTIIGFLWLKKLIPETKVIERPAYHWARLAIWPIVGLITTWLGFVAFLPTALATVTIRTHVLSSAGESVTWMGLTWLMSGVVNNRSAQTFLRLTGLVWVITQGAVLTNLNQEELNGYAATWANNAYFFRSVTHLVPAVKQPTVFIYLPNPVDHDSPIASGHMFQYSLRYLYNDQVTGIVPVYIMAGDWQATDAGISYSETWIKEPHLFSWEAVIFFTRDSAGRVRILDKLPDPYLTAYRENRYRPYEDIVNGFVSPRVQAAFPILSGPDWARDDALVRP